MISTIQLSNQVKETLNSYKKSPRQSYEEVILNLIKSVKIQKEERKELMIEGCKEMAEENLKITKEFEAMEDLSKWEWEGDL
ncbi:hypothetical protein KAI04_03555 [Candidatus Pacearchaeota archaeon]|nr:hypothetical protein [Candidatus Pacearchaeota archaeon]